MDSSSVKFSAGEITAQLVSAGMAEAAAGGSSSAPQLNLGVHFYTSGAVRVRITEEGEERWQVGWAWRNFHNRTTVFTANCLLLYPLK